LIGLFNPSMFNDTQRGTNMVKTILRLPAVKAESGASRSTIYLRIQQGLWPKPVRLGPRSVGWPASEVAAINTARIAGYGDDQIRLLVIRLETARKPLANVL
jgi:prophage regulatory protein